MEKVLKKDFSQEIIDQLLRESFRRNCLNFREKIVL